MMVLDGILALGASKKHTKDSLKGVGALKGSPCTIKKKDYDADGNLILTFAWTDSEGVEHTEEGILRKGEKGDKGR